jgi:opacity protein-like surface antigen
MKNGSFIILPGLMFGLILFLSPAPAQAEKTFYLAPKVIVGTHTADFDGSSVTVTGKPRPPLHQIDDWGPLSGPGTSAKDTLTYGALAFGLDFYEPYGLPLRLEMEASSKAESKTSSSDGIGYMRLVSDGMGGYFPGTNVDRVGITAESIYFSMHTAFVNLYLDWHNRSDFTPYIGGGLGAAFITARAEAQYTGQLLHPVDANSFEIGDRGELKKRATNFAWHLDAGIAYQITDNLTLDLSYRYLDPGKDLAVADSMTESNYSVDILFEGPTSVKLKATHQGVMGLRYSF